MSVRIRRLFPERPLTRKDYPGGVLRATLRWDSPPPGCIRFTDRPDELIPPHQRDFSTSLHVAEEGGGKAVGFLFVLSDARLLQVAWVRAEGEVFEALMGHAVAEAGERPLLGFAPDAYDNHLVLQALGLITHEKVVSGPGGLPWYLFYSDLPPEAEDAWEGGPC